MFQQLPEVKEKKEKKHKQMSYLAGVVIFLLAVVFVAAPLKLGVATQNTPVGETSYCKIKVKNDSVSYADSVIVYLAVPSELISGSIIKSTTPDYATVSEAEAIDIGLTMSSGYTAIKFDLGPALPQTTKQVTIKLVFPYSTWFPIEARGLVLAKDLLGRKTTTQFTVTIAPE